MKEYKFKIGDWVITNGYSAKYDGKPLRVNRCNYRDCYWFDQSESTSHNFGGNSARLALYHEIPIEFRIKQQYYFY